MEYLNVAVKYGMHVRRPDRLEGWRIDTIYNCVCRLWFDGKKQCIDGRTDMLLCSIWAKLSSLAITGDSNVSRQGGREVAMNVLCVFVCMSVCLS